MQSDFFMDMMALNVNKRTDVIKDCNINLMEKDV